MKTDINSSPHDITLHHGRSIIKIDKEINGHYHIITQKRSFDFIQITFAVLHMWAVFALLWDFAHSEMTVGGYIFNLGLFAFSVLYWRFIFLHLVMTPPALVGKALVSELTFLDLTLSRNHKEFVSLAEKFSKEYSI